MTRKQIINDLTKLEADLQKRIEKCEKEAEKCGWYLEMRREYEGEGYGLQYCFDKIAKLKKKYESEGEGWKQ